MEIEKKVIFNPKCSQEEKEQIENIINNLDNIEDMVDGDCETCPFCKTCHRQARNDVCLIHAVEQTLEILAGKVADNELMYD